MHVLLTKGRLEPISQKRILDAAPVLRRGRRPTYFYSSIYSDLLPACEKRGWSVDTFFVGSGVPQRLRKPDVIVNLISEPLLCERPLNRLERFVRDHPIPVMNSVEATRRSSRLALASVLANVEPESDWKLRVPLTTRFTGTFGGLAKHVEERGHKWPIIVRPPGIHGGRGMRRVDGPQSVKGDPGAPADILVTDFVDYSSPEGIFQKTRMIWADGMLFRRHRIFSNEWDIGGEARSYMLDRPQLIDSEREFLSAEPNEFDDLVSHLFGAVGLNFGLLDCSVSADKRLTVFELNGSFQISSSIPEERKHVWGYLEESNEPILKALLAGIERRGSH